MPASSRKTAAMARKSARVKRNSRSSPATTMGEATRSGARVMLSGIDQLPLVRRRDRLVDDGGDIEDQGDAAVAKDGGGGHAWDVAIIGFEALNDDLALAV